MEDKKNITGIRIEVLNKDNSQLNSFYQQIMQFVIVNPNLKDAGANADFLMRNTIFQIVESDLKEAGLITETTWKFLFFKGKKLVLTKEGLAARESAVQEIRANILEDGEIDMEVIVNVLILEKLMWLKRYFSEFEQKELKDKIKMIKETNPEINTKIINLTSFITSFDDSLIILLGAVS